MIRLNGWQRLWVLFNGLILVLICALTIIIWPMPENTFHRDQFYKNLRSEFQKIIIVDNKYGFIPKSQGAIGTKGEMPNGHIILFSNKATSDEENKAAQEYWHEVEKETNHERWTTLLLACLTWIITCAVIYIIGYSIAWVINGFKKH